MVVVVVVWGIVELYKHSKGYVAKPETKPKPKSRKDDLGGLLIGGLILIFVGFAFSAMDYSTSGHFFTEPSVVFTSFITGGIGVALLISFVVLNLMEKKIAKLERPGRK